MEKIMYVKYEKCNGSFIPIGVLIVYEILVDKIFFSLHYPTLLIIRPVCRT